VGAIPLDLLVRADSAEHNLSKVAALEGAVGDSADDLERLLDNGNRQMSPIVNQTRNVIFGHLRQLLLKNAFQACEDDERIAVAIVVDHAKLDFAISLFDDGGLGCR